MNDPTDNAETHDPAFAKYNARLGLILFALYSAFYAIFVVINAFAPTWMEQIVWADLNLAVVYGFALIGAAFFVAVVYGLLAKSPTSEVPEKQKDLRP